MMSTGQSLKFSMSVQILVGRHLRVESRGRNADAFAPGQASAVNDGGRQCAACLVVNPERDRSVANGDEIAGLQVFDEGGVVDFESRHSARRRLARDERDGLPGLEVHGACERRCTDLGAGEVDQDADRGAHRVRFPADRVNQRLL